MFNFYDVYVKRQVPYLIIEQVKAVCNIFTIRRRLLGLIDEKETFFFFCVIAEEDPSEWNRDDIGFLRKENREVNGHIMKEDMAFFVLPSHYGGNCYSQERLDKIMSEGNTVFPLMRFDTLSITFELRNLRASPIETNWGTTADIALVIRDDAGKVSFETILGTDNINPNNTTWHNELIQYFDKDFKDPRDPKMIVVDYKACLNDGTFFEGKYIFDIESAAILTDEEDLEKKVKYEFIVLKDKVFEINRDKNKSIKKDICNNVLAWYNGNVNIKKLKEDHQKALESDFYKMEMVNGEMMVNGFYIDKAVLSSENIEIVVVTKENPIHKIVEERLGISDYTDLINITKILNDLNKDFVLIANGDQAFLDEFHYNEILRLLLKNSYEHALAKKIAGN